MHGKITLRPQNQGGTVSGNTSPPHYGEKEEAQEDQEEGCTQRKEDEKDEEDENDQEEDRKKRKEGKRAKRQEEGKDACPAAPLRGCSEKAKPAKKKITAQKKQAISQSSAAVMQRLIGKVVHYYDRIGVAIVDLKEPLSIGDMIMLKKGGTIVPQRVESMQIEHASVCSAKRGDVIGLKVDAEAHEGTLVLPG